MKKLKDKLIHLLGGLTTEDMKVRTRPVKVRTFESDVRKIEVKQIIQRHWLELYPDYIENYAKKDMAYMLADKMIEEGLALYTNNQFSSADDHIKVRMWVNVIVPYE